ncbi:hypothetical protein SAMN02787144_103838 [Streptomyces atratus]|uniref:Uncharacterized protein n=1 Tax=Streptomyces atratus TaxID=1893 RepID=A0A1K2F8D2_STRAR|nr:hypothetical protein SAMN02787144_103838 [Streptomyces atratus]
MTSTPKGARQNNDLPGPPCPGYRTGRGRDPNLRHETILKQCGKGFFSLPPGKLLNYTPVIGFYPMSALNWILAALSCALFLGVGASGRRSTRSSG